LNKNTRKIFEFFILLGLGILLLYLAFKDVKIVQLWTDIKNANYWWVLLSLLFATLGFILRALRWKCLIEPLGYGPKDAHLFHSVMIGYLTNLASPRLGEITRCGALSKTDKMPFDALLGTVIIERVIDLITLLALIAVVLVAKFEMVGGFFMKEIVAPLAAQFSSGGLWVMGGVALGVFVLGVLVLKRFMDKAPWSNKILDFVHGIFRGLKSVLLMKKRGRFLIHTVLMWTAYLLGTYVVFFAVAPTRNLGIFDGLFILVISGLGMTAPVQGGFGTFHWMTSLGLVLYGIPQEQGLVYATILHESQVVYILIVGSFSLYWVFFSNQDSRSEPR
jgi:hypothetical protein